MRPDPTAKLIEAPVGELASLDLRACTLLHGLGVDFRDSEQKIRELCASRRFDATMLGAALAALDLALPDVEDSRANWQTVFNESQDKPSRSHDPVTMWHG